MPRKAEAQSSLLMISVRYWNSVMTISGRVDEAPFPLIPLHCALLGGAAQLTPSFRRRPAFVINVTNQLGPTLWWAPIVDTRGMCPADRSMASEAYCTRRNRM